MSISTASICSHYSCSASDASGSSAQQKFQVEHWRRELVSKVNVYDGDLHDFLDLFVPSNTPCPLDAPDARIAEDFHPLKGHEVEHYDPLILIFNRIVATFPEDKRLSFCNTHSQTLSFPFTGFAEHHHKARPDISVSFPGDDISERSKSPNWLRYAMIMEAKSTAAEDAFDARAGLDRTNAIVQLAINARSLMFAHGLLAAYTIGIYGEMIRIARFDHSCAVASASFSIKSQDGLQILQEFFWRFVHPWKPSLGAIVGCDDTLRKMNASDEVWLRKKLGAEAKSLLAGVNLREGRVVDVWNDDVPEGSAPTKYLLFKLLEVNARLFSRSTMVWMGVEYNEDDDFSSELELRIIKEAWRQIIRIPESKFYDRLHKTIPEEEWIGLPRLVGGGDLGVREVKEWEKASAAAESSRSLRSHTAKKRFQTPPRPMHQTFSWRLAVGDDALAYERSHMRIVVDTVGRPLSRFRSTRELVAAIRDAIKGHRLAMERGGILHRDVSSGNILIVDRPPPTHQCAGILHDYDYSSMTLYPPEINANDGAQSDATLPALCPLEHCKQVKDAEKRKERTGTYYFIALELMDPEIKCLIHNAGHDLESFFWVLLWIVLRHTAHNHADGRNACDLTFPFGSDTLAAGMKSSWLRRQSPLLIANNAPLTDLLDDFKDLVDDATKQPSKKPNRPSNRVPITYDRVLALFDDALIREDWPENDAAIPYTPLKTSTNSVYEPGRLQIGSNKSVKKRHREEDGLESGYSDLESTPVESRAASGSSKRQRRDAASAPPLALPSWGSAATSITRVQSGATQGRAEGKASGSRKTKASKASKASKSSRKASGA
ncbi:hypothetical protein C8Q73DRAFT_462505 [Cubamyces lactineus]|nr:hypothetical protein C8Q73DRAFT_462505 [Cubamyces lactineus]